jgi:hypothetical protein
MTLVVVAGLLEARALVEIEATAILPETLLRASLSCESVRGSSCSRLGAARFFATTSDRSPAAGESCVGVGGQADGPGARRPAREAVPTCRRRRARGGGATIGEIRYRLSNIFDTSIPRESQALPRREPSTRVTRRERSPSSSRSRG